MLASSLVLLIALAAQADPAAASPTGPTALSVPAEKPRVLVLDLEASGVDAQQAKLINGLITESMSRFDRFEVTSSADVRQLVEVEANRSESGCDTASCLAEIAGAIGARWVVFGNVGKLGKLTVLTMSPFDTAQAKAVGRERIEAEEIETLPHAIDVALATMMGEPVPPPPPAKGPSAMLIGGAVGAGAGAITAVALGLWAAVLDDGLGKPATSPRDKETALATGPLVLAGVAASGLVALVGGGVVTAALVLE